MWRRVPPKTKKPPGLVRGFSEKNWNFKASSIRAGSGFSGFNSVRSSVLDTAKLSQNVLLKKRGNPLFFIVDLRFPDDNLVLVDFDDTGAVIGEHLVVNFIDDAFILETGEVVDFFQLLRVDGFAGLVYESDLDVRGRGAP